RVRRLAPSDCGPLRDPARSGVTDARELRIRPAKSNCPECRNNAKRTRRLPGKSARQAGRVFQSIIPLRRSYSSAPDLASCLSYIRPARLFIERRELFAGGFEEARRRLLVRSAFCRGTPAQLTRSLRERSE